MTRRSAPPSVPRPSLLAPSGTVPFWRSPLFGNTLALCALLIVAVDRPVSVAMQRLDPTALAIFETLTDLGKSDGWLWISGLLALYLGWRRWGAIGRMKRALTGWGAGASLFFFAAVAGSGILVNLLKVLFGRARPRMLERHEIYEFHPVSFDPDFHAFPSGHANTLTAVALALALFLPRSYRLPLFLLGVALGFTRVLVNAHYVSDVVAGVAVAVVTTLWLRNLCARRGWVFVTDGDGGVRLAAPGRLLRREARRRIGMLWTSLRRRVARRTRRGAA